ncbi:MAG: DUF1553 domain-containing protein [Planctomycetales bacterium]|nr:DUF1553 domain-containing protein [Planctomycetales bacterium]
MACRCVSRSVPVRWRHSTVGQLQRGLWLCLGIFAAALAALPVEAQEDAPIDFQSQIRPLLSDRCYRCHGPNDQSREAGLRLDHKPSAFGALESGATAIVPGDVGKSELVARIESADADEHMPPPDSGKKLTPDEVQLLKRWIASGAEWQEHWAFAPPVRPALPDVKNMTWPAGAIDRFVLARLEAERLSPSAPADKQALLRRVTFDLTGLPPTLEELDAFLQDDSPEAYEKVVDRLLASPRYGEHMGRFWLDAARYGDTHGLHLDNYREMWPYRDWVVKAFNENKPYDIFTVEQLAGDLLEGATPEQQVATGFNRCHVTTNEGGSIAAEVDMRNVVDRVVTTATVFMGMTFECTRCHDHKYDPFTRRDFYSMYAFFNSLEGNPMDGNAAQHAPVLRVASPEQVERLAAIDARFAEIEKLLAADSPEADAAQTAWEAEVRADQPTQWTVAEASAASASGGATLKKLDDGSYLAEGANPDKEVYEFTIKLTAGDRTAVRLEGLIDPSLTAGGAGRSSNSNVVLSEFEAQVAPPDKPDAFTDVKFTAAWADHEQTNGDFKIANAIDGKVETGWAIAGHEKKENRTAVFVAEAPFGAVDGLLRVRLRHESIYSQHQFGRVRLALTDAQNPLPKKQSLPAAILQTVNIEAPQRTAEQAAALRSYYRSQHNLPGPLAALVKEKQELQKERGEVEKAQGTTLVSKEMGSPKKSFILKRGEYDQPGEEVGRATPLILPPLPEGAPLNRLGLAQWLTSPEHPLMARVAVNRFWQQLFGTGIVKTSEDFGSQGDPPTHPRLLDWLAVEFRESGWNIKGLMKQMVMSSTYRQTSQITPEALARDPNNRLLARGPRFRLDAEMLRDQALAVSGLLVNKLGGPSVKPPQPDGLWFAVGYTGSNTSRFKQDQGPDKVYRRTVYTFFKRTAPPPEMGTFDAPSRESCAVRRERTNTPLQMLLLMNDPQYVEAARALAERVIASAGEKPEDRAALMFRLCTARRPAADELAELLAFYTATREDFAAAEADAAKLVAVGETPPQADMQKQDLAAWTMVANLTLCLDEVVTKN